MKKKYKALINDTVIFAIGSLGSKMVLFLLLPLYTNFLTSAEYGIADLVFSASQLFVPILSVVIYGAVLRFAISQEDKAEDVLLVGLTITLLGGIINVLIAPVIGMYDALSDWKWYLCIYVFLNMLLYVEGNYLKAVNKNKLYAFINIFQTLLLAALNIFLLAFLRMGIKGYLIATIGAYAVMAVFAFFAGGLYRDLHKARFNGNLTKNMLCYSAPLILTDISWWVTHSANKIMIEAVIGATALGIYTVASKIPSLINVCTAIFSQAWNLSAVRDVESDKDTKFYSNIFSLYSAFLFGLCMAINLVIKPFMGIYVGDAFFDAWKYVPVLLVSAVFFALSEYFCAFYVALKKSKNTMFTTLITAIINVILNIVLINVLGIWGAVVATTVAYFIASVIRMIDVLRFVKIKINYAYYIVNMVLVIVQAVVVTFDLHYSISIGLLVAYCVLNVPKLFVNLKKKV